MSKEALTTRRAVSVIAFVLCSSMVAAGARGEEPAKEDPNADIIAQTNRTEARTKQYEAETKAIEARTNRAKARIDALGLPSFDGKTKMNQGAGEIEATMLSSYTLSSAASKIADGLGGEILVVTGSEAIDFGQVSAIKAEMAALKLNFETALRSAPQVQRVGEETEDVALIAAAISGAIKLLQSEIEVTAMDTAAISERLLATAVAGKLPNQAILPSAATGKTPSAAESPIRAALEELVVLRLRADSVRAGLNVKKPAHKRADAALEAASKRYDDFLTRVTAHDDKSVSEIASATRLEQLLKNNRKVLRVYVDKAGGTMLNMRNIATTFGADPVRITGGIVASYTVTDPTNGLVSNAGIVVCRSAYATLREVHNGTWRTRKSNGQKPAPDLCEKLA